MSNVVIFESQLNEALEKAIDELLSKYESGTFDVSLRRVRVDNTSGVLHIHIHDLKASALPLGMPYRTKFYWRGHHYEIISYKQRKCQKPWVCLCLTNNRNYNFPTALINLVVEWPKLASHYGADL